MNCFELKAMETLHAQEKLFYFIFLFWKEGRKRGGGRQALMWERRIDWLPSVSIPATQACALTGNQTDNLWVCGMIPTRPHQPGPRETFPSPLKNLNWMFSHNKSYYQKSFYDIFIFLDKRLITKYLLFLLSCEHLPPLWSLRDLASF